MYDFKKIDKTLIMGILNITPDSFSDGNAFFNCNKAVTHACEMASYGADIIDIGGQSTRPAATVISWQEEWARIEKALPIIKKETSLPVSVDTFYVEVAKKALENGADIINDVSGKVDPKMGEIVKSYGACWIIMHNTENNVHEWLSLAAEKAVEMGVASDKICLDPGIGFNKNDAQNYELILNTSKIKVPGFSYLLGASRKRCVTNACGSTDLYCRDCATIAAHTIGILGGANIIRSHDVLGAAAAAKTADKILGR